MGEVRRYTGKSQQEAWAWYEVDLAAMNAAGWEARRTRWSTEPGRFRSETHILEVDWAPEDPWEGVRFADDGSFRLNVSTAAAAKQAIAELKDRKKDLQLAKRELTAQASYMRQENRIKKAERGLLVRGGGSTGSMIRYAQRAGRRAENEQMARSVAGVEHQKIVIDRMILEVDRAIAQLVAADFE